jgi:transposase
MNIVYFFQSSTSKYSHLVPRENENKIRSHFTQSILRDAQNNLEPIRLQDYYSVPPSRTDGDDN